jgi:7-cyano-7-deazaguanine synthase
MTSQSPIPDPVLRHAQGAPGERSESKEESRQRSLVLLSGGLDSAVLAAEEAQTRTIHPVYVAAGLAWEEGEQSVIARLLSRPPLDGRAAPLVRLEFSMRDIYSPSHWALTGTPPAYDTPDEDVYLQGRNIALLSKAAVYAATRNISRIVLAPLAGNPFPDATPQFLKALGAALSLGLDAPIRIAAPFSHLHKADVIKRGVELSVPFELTLSCMNPAGTEHCGLCSKCRERHDAFIEAGITDPTTYANPSPR